MSRPLLGPLSHLWVLNANALLFINNVSFIDTALGQTSATAKVTLLWPVASAVSRVAAGGLSDRFERRISRTGFLFLAAVTMTGVNAFLVFELQSVEVGAVIVGCCFGATWCLTPLIVDDEFGSASFGQTWSTLMVASAIGGFMLAPIEDAAYREHTAPGARECYLWSRLLQPPSRLSAGLAAVASLLSLCLARAWAREGQII